MTEEAGSTQVPPVFDTLDDNYFSLGMSENYYETLNSIGEGFAKEYLSAVKDCAFSLHILDENIDEPVMQHSLLRDIDIHRVRERLHRLATGNSILTRYSFAYKFPVDDKAMMPPPVLTFSVVPSSIPATNIHVLIGRNGVGKTRCFDLLARSLLGIQDSQFPHPVGEIVNAGIAGSNGNPWSLSTSTTPDFAGLVTVSFSAFDSRGPLGGVSLGNKRYAYIGLVTHEPQQKSAPPEMLIEPRVKGSNELAHEFADSVLACREGVRRKRWKSALETLQADPLFAEANVSALANDTQPNLEDRARALFRKLSSGHAVVLLSITRLVELVEEKSLVLIDEPESHLHPPLLSAFIRALSNLLTDRNGVALIATHSPVVLQEVPQSCVWKLSRSGHEARVDRPESETFGENVGVLTREVFGLEVTQTGFHKLVADMVQGRTYEQVLAVFGGQLGAEGRSLARALSLLPSSQMFPGTDD